MASAVKRQLVGHTSLAAGVGNRHPLSVQIDKNNGEFSSASELGFLPLAGRYRAARRGGLVFLPLWIAGSLGDSRCVRGGPRWIGRPCGDAFKKVLAPLRISIDERHGCAMVLNPLRIGRPDMRGGFVRLMPRRIGQSLG